MEEIIVIRAADPDGSVFQAVMDALSGKRAEVVDVAEQSASVLRIGDLEIYCNQHRAFMAGREVVLNHGEYAIALLHGQLTRASLLKSAALCGGLGGGISAWDHFGGEYHLAVEAETGAGSQAPVLYQNGC